MSKALLYATNTVSQSLADGDIINFGSVVRRYGCSCNISGGNAETFQSGYYTVDVDVTFTAGAGGTVTLQLYNDGVAIPGASTSISATSGAVECLSLTAPVIRQLCNCEKTITATLNGIATTVSVASIRVVRA